MDVVAAAAAGERQDLGLERPDGKWKASRWTRASEQPGGEPQKCEAVQDLARSRRSLVWSESDGGRTASNELGFRSR